MLIRKLQVAAASLLLSITAVTAYPRPRVCSGDCFAHDPSVIRRSDGVYFRFNTGNELGIWKTSNLSGPWHYEGKTLSLGSSLQQVGNTDLWAPDVHLINNNYIMYYTVSTGGSKSSALGYAISSTMESGSWTDQGSINISSSLSTSYNAIDANLIQAGSKYYMNFGSFWTGIYQTKMNGGATAASGSPYQLVYNSSGQHSVEGTFMYMHDKYYYLFFSSGACCDYDKRKPATGSEYKIFVCRSASVDGLFVDADGNECRAGGGTLVLASHDDVYGPGGQGVLADPILGSVLYYHYANTSIGLADADYQFGWNLVGWETGWPVLYEG